MSKSLNSSEEAKQLQETSKAMLEALRQCIDIMKDSQLTDQVCVWREKDGEREKEREGERESLGVYRVLVTTCKSFPSLGKLSVFVNIMFSVSPLCVHVASKDSVSDRGAPLVRPNQSCGFV